MLPRCVLSLITAASLLHLTLVGRDLVCSQHDADGRPPIVQAALPVLETGAHASHEAETESPCRTPGLPACCQLIASCGIAMSGGVEVDVADIAHGGTDADAMITIIPRSTTLGPEPPPPKA